MTSPNASPPASEKNIRFPVSIGICLGRKKRRTISPPHAMAKKALFTRKSWSGVANKGGRTVRPISRRSLYGSGNAWRPTIPFFSRSFRAWISVVSRICASMLQLQMGDMPSRVFCRIGMSYNAPCHLVSLCFSWKWSLQTRHYSRRNATWTASPGCSIGFGSSPSDATDLPSSCPLAAPGRT